MARPRACGTGRSWRTCFVEVGYRDYLGALQRYRVGAPAPGGAACRCPRSSSTILSPSGCSRLRSRSCNGCAPSAPPSSLSDGDVVFQPRKVERSGLWAVFFDGRVLIYVHKERELADLERFYPAKRYVMIDDKLRILDAVKKAWGERDHHFPKREAPLRSGPANSCRLSAGRHSIGTV